MSSPTTPILRSAKPSLLKSPAANDAPKKSPASAMPATPAAPCQNCWLPVLVRPLAEPCSTFTDPASAADPIASKGAPAARSTNVSLLKSPATSANPRLSPASAVPGRPPVPCQNCWLPAPVRPLAEPYSTLTSPASTIDPTSSNGTPTARSAKPSLLKSPVASENPNRSPASAGPGTPPAPCQNCWLPAPPVRPLAEPYSTFTDPASATAPISSNGTPTAASMKPSLLKSACRLPAARPAVLPCAGLITAGPTIGTSARARMIDRRRICTAFPPSGSPPLRPACRYAARHRGEARSRAQQEEQSPLSSLALCDPSRRLRTSCSSYAPLSKRSGIRLDSSSSLAARRAQRGAVPRGAPPFSVVPPAIGSVHCRRSTCRSAGALGM